MKVFVFQGGLGNQIFEYAYYQHELKKNPCLKYLFPNVKCHNGFELNRWFEVTLHEASFLQKKFFELAQRLKSKHLINLIADKDIDLQSDRYFATGYIQSKQFLADGFIQFKDFSLSEENKRYLDLIRSTESIAVHVRRGDYLQEPYKAIYSGICTEEYYKKALDLVNEKFNNPTFFVFSNDMDWVKENLRLENAYYIDCNTGENSPLDMFLMSKTKGLVLANSTFSYWGAKLNGNKELVVYPKKWINKPFEIPNIFDTDWLGI